jgi:hypothetical protein
VRFAVSRTQQRFVRSGVLRQVTLLLFGAESSLHRPVVPGESSSGHVGLVERLRSTITSRDWRPIRSRDRAYRQRRTARLVSHVIAAADAGMKATIVIVGKQQGFSLVAVLLRG